MASKYVDTSSIVQVIGCIYKTPQLLEYTDKYFITEEDFPNQFHKIVFGVAYNLHELGAERITINSVLDYLAARPNSESIFIKEKGEEWILKAVENAQVPAFDYYYNRMKKMTLLRAFDKLGIDLRDIYDVDNILDIKKKQEQENFLDNSSLESLAQLIQDKIDEIKATYVSNTWSEAHQAGDGIFDLLDDLKKKPDVGVPLYGSLMNTVTRGARLGKMYLRSAATGVGKTRTLIADACFIACNRIYDGTFGQWLRNGTCEPTLFIATEQDLTEVQTMMMAFLSDVNEEHIMNSKYVGDEEERVKEAAKIISESPLYVELLPDFSIDDVENVIKKNIREHDVSYVFYDYIQSSLKILEEIATKTKGMKLREDNILFMLAARLKDICNHYGIFLMTATQLNGSYIDSETPDQNLLRGAKSIADRIDWGGILLGVTAEDIKGLEEILKNNAFSTPNVKISIYKNRRGRYKGIYLWCNADLGTCRVLPVFATTYNYEIVEISKLKINTTEPGAFEN